MKTFAFCILALCLAVAVSGDRCRYNCYEVDAVRGQQAKEEALKGCGVTDYRFTTSDLISVYKRPVPANCKVAVCAKFPDEAAISSYRDVCERRYDAYNTLLENAVGNGYNADCTTCAAS